MYKFTHVNATTVADATAKMAGGKAQVLAGGTDLITSMKAMISPNPPTTLVNIKNHRESGLYQGRSGHPQDRRPGQTHRHR